MKQRPKDVLHYTWLFLAPKPQILYERLIRMRNDHVSPDLATQRKALNERPRPPMTTLAPGGQSGQTLAHIPGELLRSQPINKFCTSPLSPLSL